MKKILLTTCWLWAILLGAFAQDENRTLKIAVFDPTVSGDALDESIRITVREIISAAFVNYSGKYSIVERSLLDKIMQEAKFSNTDAVDENQATELGKLAGADKVVLSIVTQAGSTRNMLSIKLIDVQTATVEKQKTKVVMSSTFLDAIEPLTLSLLGQEYVETPNLAKTPIPQPKTSVQTAKKTVVTKSNKGQMSSALVHSIVDFVYQDLEEKANRYRTDEERIKRVKSNKELTQLIRFAAKYITNVPNTNSNEVVFFCPGIEKSRSVLNVLGGGDTPLFLYVDGKLVGAGTEERGLDGVVPNDGRQHYVALYRYKTKIYSETVNFSIKNEYIFRYEDKRIHL